MTPIQVTYSDERLRTLVEEYITMQKHEFNFNDLCSYVLYWAREEGKTANTGLFESNQLHNIDCNRIKLILKKIMDECRIIGKKNTLQDETVFVKVKE